MVSYLEPYIRDNQLSHVMKVMICPHCQSQQLSKELVIIRSCRLLTEKIGDRRLKKSRLNLVQAPSLVDGINLKSTFLLSEKLHPLWVQTISNLPSAISNVLT